MCRDEVMHASNLYNISLKDSSFKTLYMYRLYREVEVLSVYGPTHLPIKRL